MSGHIWKQNWNSVLSRDLKDVEVLPRMYCCLIIKWPEIPCNILQLSSIEGKAELTRQIYSHTLLHTDKRKFFSHEKISVLKMTGIILCIISNNLKMKKGNGISNWNN